jgi:hypothetical protein
LREGKIYRLIFNLKFFIFTSLQFGNVALGWNFAEWAKANGLSLTGTKIDNLMDVGNKEDGVKIVIKVPNEVTTIDDRKLMNNEVMNNKLPNEEIKEEKKGNDCLNKTLKEALESEEFFNFEYFKFIF